MLTKKENYIRASLTVATRMDEHQLFSPTHGSPKFLWLFANNRKFPGMRFHCSKLGNIRWAAHFSLDCFGNVDWSNKNASIKMTEGKKQINHFANILIMLAFSHVGCKLHDFNKTWMKRMDKGLGQGMCNRCWLEQQCCHGYKRTCTAWTSLTALQTKHVFFFRHPTHKTRVNQKKLHLPNGPISRKKMEANGWWR